MGKCRLLANPGLQPSILVQWFVVSTESYSPAILPSWNLITPRAGDTDWHVEGGGQGSRHAERQGGWLAEPASIIYHPSPTSATLIIR